MYDAKIIPPVYGLSDLQQFLNTELQEIASSLAAMQTPHVQLSELHNEPVRPRDGMVVFADGTDWNPGSGRGVYVYSSSAWSKL